MLSPENVEPFLVVLSILCMTQVQIPNYIYTHREASFPSKQFSTAHLEL